MELRDFHDPQPPPVPREGAPSMHDIAAALHLMRRDHGLAKYGSRLQVHNGRNADVDRVQESLDGLVYELQRTIEAAALREALGEFRRQLDALAADADTALSARQVYEDLLNPAALAVRADEIARRLIAAGR